MAAGDFTALIHKEDGVMTFEPGSVFNLASAPNFVVAIAAPHNELGGAGYFESDVSGTFAGHFYGMGSWINFGAASITGGNIIAAQDNGIYGTATMTNSIIVFGMRMEGIVTGTPGQFVPFSLNTANRSITALFNIASGPSIGAVNGTPTAAASGSIPLFVDGNGTVKYARYYDSPTA
jgi:hypothetical protein